MTGEGLPRRIKVVGYSGYKADERPLHLFPGDRRVRVKEVIDRWYGTEHDYFKVYAEDEKYYLLKRHRTLDIWVLLQILDRKNNVNKPSPAGSSNPGT